MATDEATNTRTNERAVSKALDESPNLRSLKLDPMTPLPPQVDKANDFIERFESDTSTGDGPLQAIILLNTANSRCGFAIVSYSVT
jgi:hypothetical protein